MLTPLREATEEHRFGGKAAGLARSLRAGLPAPDGVALDVAAARRIADGGSLPALPAALRGRRYAVRSSAIGEDSGGSSFAGQHRTMLGVPESGLERAVAEVVASAAASAAYRERRGLDAHGMGVVIQPLVDAVAAGVLFSAHPVTGAPGIVIEAAWGLGELVVSGRITPDHWELSPDGALVAFHPGDQDVVLLPDGDGTVETALPTRQIGRPCLTEADLAALVALTRQLDAVFSGPHDVEFAVTGSGIVLLQRRPITR